MIQLRHQSAQRYHGFANYLVSYDYMAGKRDRYTTIVLCADNALVIGRQLTLGQTKSLIADYEAIGTARPAGEYDGGSYKDMLYITSFELPRLRQQRLKAKNKCD